MWIQWIDEYDGINDDDGCDVSVHEVDVNLDNGEYTRVDEIIVLWWSWRLWWNEDEDNNKYDDIWLC